MLFKEFTQDIEVNGHKITANIQIEVHEDDTAPEGDFDFGNEADNQAYLSRFKSGELFMGNIIVHARALGIEGWDSLHACHLYSNNYFDSSKFDQSVNETLEVYSMVENALNELKTNIVEQAKALAKFA